jgi:glycerol-3-phosphate dehydrogenase
MAEISARTRREALADMTAASLDVLVIGGGITGAGVALDAAARGYRVGLIERGDFASGTSSRSTKLVHGGIRYLPELDFPLVREALIERGRLLRNAPHLVRPLAFVLPLYASSRHPVGLPVTPPGGIGLGMILDAGLFLYDLLAGKENVGAHRRLPLGEVRERAASLTPDGLKAGFIYYDAQTDDARLTLAALRSAADRGALLANYAAATHFVRDTSGSMTGVVARDQITGDELTIAARQVVNAAGVWAEDVERLAGEARELEIAPSKGAHLVFERETLGLGDEAVVLPETRDGRIIFIVPWRSRALVGTTDEPAAQADAGIVAADEIDYLLAHLNRYLRQPVTRDDIVSTFAGFRPLLRLRRSSTPARLSRTHAVVESPDGLISVSGGKLTTYRKMAEDVLDRVDRRLGAQRDGSPASAKKHPTRRLKLSGAEGLAAARAEIVERARALGISAATTEHLLSDYGVEARALLDLIAADGALGCALVAGLPYMRAEVIHAVRAEQALTVEDVLARRTRIALEDRLRGLGAAEDVAALMALELGWDQAERARQVAAYRRYVLEQAGPLAEGLRRAAESVGAITVA